MGWQNIAGHLDDARIDHAFGERSSGSGQGGRSHFRQRWSGCQHHEADDAKFSKENGHHFPGLRHVLSNDFKLIKLCRSLIKSSFSEGRLPTQSEGESHGQYPFHHGDVCSPHDRLCQQENEGEVKILRQGIQLQRAAQGLGQRSASWRIWRERWTNQRPNW